MIVYMYIVYSQLTIKKVQISKTRLLGVYATSQTTLLHRKIVSKTESPIFILLCVPSVKGKLLDCY